MGYLPCYFLILQLRHTLKQSIILLEKAIEHVQVEAETFVAGTGFI